MNPAESVMNSWWLLPMLWVALSLLATAALRTASRDAAPQPEEADPVPAASAPFGFDLPDAFSETIGWYMGTPIHRSASFGGIEYEFDRICPPQALRRASGERVVAPGIVYTRRTASRR